MSASSSEGWTDDTSSSAASSFVELGSLEDKWPGAWRRIGLDDFKYNYRRNARHPGYAVSLKVLLDEHWHCNCHRSDNPEEVILFLPHTTALGKFPVNHWVSKSWSDYANAHGFDCPTPGFIVKMSTISYGYLSRLPMGLIVCQ